MTVARALVALTVAAPVLAGCGARPPIDPQSIVIAPAPPAPPAPPEPPAPPAEAGPPALEVVLTWGALCARVGGRVHCGTLADPARPLSAEPPLGGIEDAVSLTSGQGFLCLATARGTVHCWGDNHFGQLGARLRDERHEAPVQVANVAGARRVVAGPWHVCALLSGGRAACWGRNEHGQTGSAVAYAAEARELVEPAEVPAVLGITSLAAAYSTTCATTAARELWCWGEAKHQEHPHDAHTDVPTPSAELAGVADLTAGESALCGVREGGIRCWGDSWALASSEQPRRGVFEIPTPRPARRVRIANSHGCALLRDGSVACFGAAYTGALGREVADGGGTQPARIVEGLPRAVDVAVGASMSCAVTEPLDVYCWGTFPAREGGPQITPQKIRIKS